MKTKKKIEEVIPCKCCAPAVYIVKNEHGSPSPVCAKCFTRLTANFDYTLYKAVGYERSGR